jgi:hypothetical protein
MFGGLAWRRVILVTAIPFGIYDLVEAMDNVESAEAGGDHFSTTVITADGMVSLIGCLPDNPSSMPWTAATAPWMRWRMPFWPGCWLSPSTRRSKRRSRRMPI